MRHATRLIRTLLILLLVPAAAYPTPSKTEATGQVEIPLDVYNRLVAEAGDPTRHPRPAPAGYALGSADVQVLVPATEPRASAAVRVKMTVDVLEDDWVLIPVLPAGTPVEQASVSGKPVQLIASPLGLAWSTRQSGSYELNLTYRADAIRSPGGFSLPVPLPAAAAIRLQATLPGTGLDATVLPAAGVEVVSGDRVTVIHATVPTSNGVQISWRSSDDLGHAISRATYRGSLQGDAIVWTAEIAVELFTDEMLTLPLLPRSVALSGLTVDGRESPILVDEASGRFATRLDGRGLHTVSATFEVQVDRASGPPRVELLIPEIPVSRFDLALPGHKELSVSPASNVTSRVDDERTVATVHVPMTDRVDFSWSEAVPEDLRTEVRSNASAFHTVYAEEGVLYVHALLQYEVTRGQTSTIELLLPKNVQINRIGDRAGAVNDWRLGKPDDDGRRAVTVFLDREIEGKLMLDVFYDRSLRTGEADTVPVPLIWAVGAQRQRGMVALLQSADLELEPVEATELTAVGENQLPPDVREGVSMTIAHTFKYAETLPSLIVRLETPEREQGKFDARVDTLVSLGDVTLRGSASVEVHVKSGSIMELVLGLPDGVNLLSLTAPSVRTHRVVEGEAGRRVEVEFTQEMEGEFRVDVSYERITAEAASPLDVPTLSVLGAEVEQGRIAVEALSAVEVRPAKVEQLTGLDIAELPRQLVLRTTNPILLAYKYVQAVPPPLLTLDVTRHPVLEVQEATIDRAEYRTLFTRDGLLVTTADFTVRNSRKQFLRIDLPRDAEVWSAFVNGKPEQPAIAAASSDDGPRSVLIKILNSTDGFPVRVVFATHGKRLRGLGRIEGSLPRPDILVTHSRWDVYLPDDMRYGDFSTNLELVQTGQAMTEADMKRAMLDLEGAAAAGQVIRPLSIQVPTSGVHYALEKLYANQADEKAWFAVPYASKRGARLGEVLALAGVALFWLGVLTYLSGRSRLAAAASALAGLSIVTVTLGVFKLGATLPLAAAVLIGLAVLAFRARHHLGSPDATQPAS